MDGGLPRPHSALARGVHITELSDGCTNPEPVVLQETDLLMEQYLSPSKLQALTGSDNLETVTMLELRVDTSETSLNNFGALLPNLTVLKLTGSIIPNIRDLGSSLHQLEVLWMSRCALQELDGVSSMLSMRELYLAYNEIQDISPLAMMEDLEILDLEGNNIDDIGQIQYLTLCTKLRHLTLDGNPVCIMPTVHAQEVNYDYRQMVRKTLTHLSVLDDNSLSAADSRVTPNAFDADWAYLEELQRDALVRESRDSQPGTTVPAAGSPGTAALRPATAYRPGSALRPSSGFRPTSTLRRPASISGGRPSSAWTEGSTRRPASSDTVEGMESSSELVCVCVITDAVEGMESSSELVCVCVITDAVEGMESSSELTRGVVICGNPSKALRARRPSTNSQESVDQTSHPVNTQPSPQTPSTVASSSPSPRLKEPMVRRAADADADAEEEEEGGGKGREEGAEEASSEDQDLRLLMEELHSWKMDHEKRLEKIRESKAPQVFTIDRESSGDDNNLSDQQESDLSDTDDLDLRPDSAMDRYRHQLSEKESHPSPPPWTKPEQVTGLRRWGEGDTGVSPEDRSTERSLAKRPGQEQKLKDYEKSMDEDQRLLKEYQRLQALERQREKAQGGSEPPSRELRELRVPSAGPNRHPHSPRRGVSPKPAPFLPMDGHPLGLGLGPADAVYRANQKPRKIKIGPTGLPGSSHAQQPQIRDVLTPPGKVGLSAPGAGALRPPSSSSSLQHKFRRTLPEVPPYLPAPRPSPSPSEDLCLRKEYGRVQGKAGGEGAKKTFCRHSSLFCCSKMRAPRGPRSRRL
ncbi:hypothetical protein ACOMHN_024998 [Nucella lapillus]